MPGSSMPLLTDPSMWYPRMPDLELAEEVPEGEADEPYIVDGEPEEPQP